MENGQLNWIANFIWGIADDVLRDLYVRGKYRDVILPMTVLRRLDAFLANPGVFAPGARMTYGLSDPEDRSAVIEYLEKLPPRP